MKKLALIAAALTLLSASAHAETYHYGKNRVVIPSGCASWSCISVSVPGHYSHNVKPENKSRTSQKVATSSSASAAATSSTTTPATSASTAPVQTNTAPSTGSNVTVLPAPAATTSAQ